MKQPWQPGHVQFTHLLTGKSRSLILSESSLILNPRKQTIKMKEMLPPGKILTFFMDQKKYMLAIAVFDDWMKEKNCTIEDIMYINIPFTYIEFMTWLVRTKKTKSSSAKHHESIYNTMLSHIIGKGHVSTTAQILTTHAISNHQINNPIYRSIQDINQLRWRIQIYPYRSQMMKIKQQQFSIHPNNLNNETYDVRKTRNPRVCPTEIFFVWLIRL
ncbi:MAG: hypothetical protein EZS28_049243 [Streblomastix strix]|uniref:Uncharacterized protein n=1 Tax=Streblomastix strix TaxID=222440 RepID=A0A5J4TCE9_9EUKA|nr:MAG: hypothetical protein EZS28_049243 [Streblomastix strix]